MCPELLRLGRAGGPGFAPGAYPPPWAGRRTTYKRGRNSGDRLEAESPHVRLLRPSQKIASPGDPHLVLFINLILAVGFVIYGLFFVRRQIYQYWPAHTFGISSPEFLAAHTRSRNIHSCSQGIKSSCSKTAIEIFPAMLGAIQAAKTSVSFEAYILYSDSIGRKFRDALCERAQAGVRVRIILDGIGSSTNSTRTSTT